MAVFQYLVWTPELAGGAPGFASTKYRYRCRPKRVRIWSASSGQTGRQTPQETGGRLGIPQTPAVVNNKRPADQPTRRVRREARPNVQGQAAAGRAAQGFGGRVGLAWTLHSTLASCAGGERTLAGRGGDACPGPFRLEHAGPCWVVVELFSLRAHRIMLHHAGFQLGRAREQLSQPPPPLPLLQVPLLSARPRRCARPAKSASGGHAAGRRE